MELTFHALYLGNSEHLCFEWWHIIAQNIAVISYEKEKSFMYFCMQKFIM